MPNEFLSDNFITSDDESEAVRIAADHLRQGRTNAARAILQEILARQPQHSGALNCLAAEALLRGDQKKSEEILGHALRCNPKDTTALINLGQLHLQNQRLAEARLCLNRAEALCEPTPALEAFRVNVLASEGAIDAAIQLQEELTSNDSKNPENFYNLGVLFTKSKRHDEAEECFQKAIFLRPSYREAWHNLGQLQARAGRSKDAIFSFKRALLLLPGDPASITALVDVLIQAGRAAEAEEEAKRGLIVTPGAIFSTLALGRAQLALGRKQEALANFAAAVRAAPEHPLPLISLARAFSATGNYAKASDAAVLACKRPGGDAFVHFTVEILLKAGRFSAAWQTIRECTPEHSYDDLMDILVKLPENILEFLCMSSLLNAAPIVLDKKIHFLPELSTTEAARILKTNGLSPQTQSSASKIVALTTLAAMLRADPTSAPLPPLLPDGEKLAAWRQALTGHSKPVIALAFNGETDGEPPLAEILQRLNFPCTKLGLLTGEARQHLSLDPDILDAGPHLRELGDMAAAMAAADFVIAGRGIGGHLAGAFGLKGAVLVPNGAEWCWGFQHGPHWFRSLHSCLATDTGWDSALTELSNVLSSLHEGARPTETDIAAQEHSELTKPKA